MAASFVKQYTGGSSTAQTTGATVTITQPASGNLLVATIALGSSTSTAQVSSIATTAGTWTNVARSAMNATTSVRTEIWVCTGTWTGSSTSVIPTFSATSKWSCNIQEWSGLETTVDVTAVTNTGAVTTGTHTTASTALTNTPGGDLVIGAMALATSKNSTDFSAATTGSPDTATPLTYSASGQTTTSNVGMQSVYDVSSTGPVAESFTWTTAAAWQYAWAAVSLRAKARIATFSPALIPTPVSPVSPSDTFTRTNQSGWGTASDGNTWANLDVSTPTLAIASNEGTYTGVATQAILVLGAATNSADGDTLARFSASNPTNAGTFVGLVARTTPTGSGGVQAYVQNGATLILGDSGPNPFSSASVSMAAGTFYWLRLRCVGTAMSARFWQDGTVEPSAWTTTYTGTITATGTVGFLAELAAGGDSFSFDHFSYSMLTGLAKTPQKTLASSAAATVALAKKPLKALAATIAGAIAFTTSLLSSGAHNTKDLAASCTAAVTRAWATAHGMATSCSGAVARSVAVNHTQTAALTPQPPLGRSGWTATASDLNGVFDPPGNALDGDLTTRYSSGHTQYVGMSYQVDMQTAQTFDLVVLSVPNSPTDYAYNLAVAVSSNGTTWTTVGSATNIWTDSYTAIPIPQQTARYLKLTITDAGSGNWWSIDELLLYQTIPLVRTFGFARTSFTSSILNPQLDRATWTVSASDYNGGFDQPPLAIDGNLATRYSTSTAQLSGMWFQIDMGSARLCTALVLNNVNDAGDYPYAYSLATSSDGVTFGSAIASGSGASGSTTISFAATSARYWRITLTASTTNLGGALPYWSIDEVYAYQAITAFIKTPLKALLAALAPNNGRQDTFTRADQSGWGTASSGYTWSTIGGNAGDAISSNVAQQTFVSGGANTNMLSPKVSYADMEMVVKWQNAVSSDGNTSVGLLLRTDQPSSGAIRAQLNIYLYGNSNIHLYDGITDESADLAIPTLSVATWYWTRYQVQGQTYRWRTWADGTGEPSTWDVTYQGTVVVPGRDVGLRNDPHTVGDKVLFGSFVSRPLDGVVRQRAVGKALASACTATVARVQQITHTATSTITGTAVIAKALFLLRATFTSSLSGAVSMARTTGKALASTCTAAVSRVQQIGKVATATLGGTVAFVRSVTHLLSATITATRTLLRDVAHAIAATCTGTVARTQAIVHMATATVQAAVTFGKDLSGLARTVLASTMTASTTYTRTVGKALAATCTGTITRLQQIAHTATATITPTMTLLVEDMLFLMTASIGATAAFTRATLHALAASVPLVAATSNALGLARATFTATITGTVSLARTASKALASSVQGTSTLLRATAHLLGASITAVGTQLRALAHTLAATCTATVAQLHQIGHGVTATLAAAPALAKDLALALAAFAASVPGTASLQRMSGKALAAALSGTVILARDLAKSLGATVAGVVDFTVDAAHRIFQNIAVTSTLAGALARDTVTTLAAQLAALGGLAKDLPVVALAATITAASSLARTSTRLLAAIATPAVQLVRLVGHFVQATTTARSSSTQDTTHGESSSLTLTMILLVENLLVIMAAQLAARGSQTRAIVHQASVTLSSLAQLGFGFPQDLAALLTASGQRTLTLARALSTSIPLAAAQARRIYHLLTAVASLQGALRRASVHGQGGLLAGLGALAGSVTVHAQQFSQALAATVAAVSSLRRGTLTTRNSTLEPASLLVRASARRLAGSLPGGVLFTRTTVRRLASSLLSLAHLTRTLPRAIGATLEPAPTLVRQTAHRTSAQLAIFPLALHRVSTHHLAAALVKGTGFFRRVTPGLQALLPVAAEGTRFIAPLRLALRAGRLLRALVPSRGASSRAGRSRTLAVPGRPLSLRARRTTVLVARRLAPEDPSSMIALPARADLAGLYVAPHESNVGFTIDMSAALPTGAHVASVTVLSVGAKFPGQADDALIDASGFAAGPGVAADVITLVVGNSLQVEGMIYQVVLLATYNNVPATTATIYVEIPCSKGAPQP